MPRLIIVASIFLLAIVPLIAFGAGSSSGQDWPRASLCDYPFMAT
jgi:hypothetical protein